MLLASIIGLESRYKTANLIHSILSTAGKKASFIDVNELLVMNKQCKLKEYLGELDKHGNDFLIIKIDIENLDLEIYKGLRFDIMLCTDRMEDLKNVDIIHYAEQMKKVFSLLHEKGIAIINADYSELVQGINGVKKHVITYGFNPKASVTTSSTGDYSEENSLLCCLQRTISTSHGVRVDPQEYKVAISTCNIEIHYVLAASAFAIINDIDLNKIYALA